MKKDSVAIAGLWIEARMMKVFHQRKHGRVDAFRAVGKRESR